MGVTLHEASVPVFVRMLGNLRGILRKAREHAEARKIDPAVLLGSRLFPDMYPLARQVVVAADAAADAGASLAQAPLPEWTNDEGSFAGLDARLAATIAFLESLAPRRFEGAEERPVSWTARGATVTLKGAPYLLDHAMPKFYFHLTTAYAILRKDGVALRKGDFMGKA